MEARLIADGGAAAADPESFFRSPPFLEAEGVTHTICGRGGRAAAAGDRAPDRGRRPRRRDLALRLPGRVGGTREADRSRSDRLVADRPGQRLRPRPDRRATRCFAGRHGAQPRPGRRRRRRDPQAPARADPPQRAPRLVRRASPPGRRRMPAARRAFERAYAETMARTGAAERYLYPSEYFERLLRQRAELARCSRPGTGSALAGRDRGGRATATSTTTSAAPPTRPWSDSPMKNLFAAMISLGPSSACRSTSAAGWPRATRSTTSSAASPTARRRSAPTR